MKLGFNLRGDGQNKVLMLNDWFCDCSSYTPMLPFLNQKDFQYALTDLRGYGASKNLQGQFNLEEATQDIIETASYLGWSKFHLVGYSMTGLVGQNVMASAKDRVKSFIGICPVGPNGMPGADEAFQQFMIDAAKGDDEKGIQIAHMVTSNRYSNEWAEYKVRGWRETSIAEARVNYAKMFLTSNIVDSVKGLNTPVLVITASDDTEGLRKEAIQQPFESCYQSLEFIEIQNAGHSPMIETPVSLATAMNTFLAKQING